MIVAGVPCLYPAPRKRNTDGNWLLTTMMTAVDDDGWCLTHSPGNRRAEIVLDLETKIDRISNQNS